MSEYNFSETNARKLSYENNFRGWIREEGVIPTQILGLLSAVPEKGGLVEAGDVSAQCIDVNEEDDTLYSKSYKLSVKGQNYFLKVENDSIEEEGANQEMVSTLLASDELQASGVGGVRVAKPLLAYQNIDNHKSYYVSEWIDLPVLDEYLSIEANKGMRDVLMNRVNQIRAVLPDYRELSTPNMFYDASKDEIVLFDLHV